MVSLIKNGILKHTHSRKACFGRVFCSSGFLLSFNLQRESITTLGTEAGSQKSQHDQSLAESVVHHVLETAA